MGKDVLSVEEEKFVQGLVLGLTQKEALKRSFDTSSMKDDYIGVKANRLLKKVKVKARYEELLGEAKKKAENSYNIDTDRVLERLSAIAFIGFDDPLFLNGNIKIGDVYKALELCAKYLDMFSDKAKVLGKVDGKIEIKWQD